MKKIAVLMVALVLSVMMLTGCTSTEGTVTATEAPAAQTTVQATVEATDVPVPEMTAEPVTGASAEATVGAEN